MYYTTDGSIPTLASTSALGTTTINITQTTIFKAFAKDVEGNVSNVLTKTYYIGAIPNFTVHFKPTVTWTAPKIYYWNATPTGNLSDITWPGLTMTPECNGWFSFNFTGITATNVIFNNGTGGAGNQTSDLTANGDSWYDGVTSSWVSTPTNTGATCLSIAPIGGNFMAGNTVTVTLSATDTTDTNPTIYYTLDGSTPSTSSSSASNSVQLPITSTTTVKAFAKNSSGNSSDIITETYTFGSSINSITVYFKPPSGWSIPKIYYWNAIPSGSIANAAWPGVAMTVHGNGWYKYTFTGITGINVIFNNGSGGVGTNQTIDLTNITADYWYDWTLGVVLGDNEIENISSQYILYPNPTVGTIKVVSTDKIAEVGIYEAKGSMIGHQIILDQEIDLRNFAAGSYILKMITESKKVIFKQVIKK